MNPNLDRFPMEEYECNICLADCSYKRYKSNKVFDCDFCPSCFSSGRFKLGLAPLYFICIEYVEDYNGEKLSNVFDEMHEQEKEKNSISKDNDGVVGDKLLNFEINDADFGRRIEEGEEERFIEIEKKLTLKASDSTKKQLIEGKHKGWKKKLHLDLVHTKSTKEKNYAVGQSARLIDANRTLSKPLSRELYLLQLEGVHVDGKKTLTDPDLLVEMMEMREAIEEVGIVCGLLFKDMGYFSKFFIFDPGGSWYLKLRSLVCCSLVHDDQLGWQNRLLEGHAKSLCWYQKRLEMKRLEMTVSEFVAHWRGLPISKCCDNSQSLLYLKDWHFAKEYPEYVAYSTPSFFLDDWLNLYLDSHSMHQGSNAQHVKNEINCSDYRFVYMGAKGHTAGLQMCVGKSNLVFDRHLKTSVYDVNGDVSDTKFPGFKKAVWWECTQEPSEIIFVPSGWYHQVYNLEDTISINHNWFNAYNLHWVWNLLVKDYKAAKAT